MKFEELNRSHNRKSFNCGLNELDVFLKNFARQNSKKGLSRTFVAIDEKFPQEILGYYTLSIFEISSQRLPAQFAKRYKDKLPAIKIARLAVAQGLQNQGIGKHLIINAIKRVVSVSAEVGTVGFFVDAKDEQARNYYLKFGFIPLPEHPLELFLPMATVHDLHKSIFQ